MLGERLKVARKHAGLTQQELAGLSELPQGHISKLERGNLNLARVRVETLRKLCDALHLTPNELMGYPHATHE